MSKDDDDDSDEHFEGEGSDKSRGKRKLFPEVAPISLHTTLVFQEIYY